MKAFIAFAVSFIVAGILLSSKSITNDNQSGVFYPDSVKKVIDNKCYGCHSEKGKSQKAKDKLMWDNLPGLDKTKVVSTLDKIIEAVRENDMPPEEFLKKFPEGKMLPGEKELLISWAEAKADSIIQ
ncbi:MAG TPA: heme-binding domain-containing protein [Bacteroidales bacterium]|nr:heme-binding domain-containing protein [Bacteroidales bacterium]